MKKLKNKYVERFDENGFPVWKKRIPDENILTKREGKEKILYAIVFVVFLIHGLTLITPLLWMIVSSLKDSLEYAGGDPFALPIKPLFSNYIDAFAILEVGKTNFLGMIFHSIWYTAVSTGLGVIVPCITGYVMSKYKFLGRDVMYAIAVTAMTIPIVGSTASHMKVIASMGVYNNPLYVFVTNLGGFGGSFLVYYGFFKTVSWSYAEAVQIDGGGPFTIFFAIMLPQALPIMGVYAITGAIGNWNAYEPVMLYLPDFPTLAYGLYEYQSNAIRLANYPLYFAGLIISMIPALALFIAFSDKIMTSLSIGGLKG